MPRYSVWAVRASLVYLYLGFSFGALMLANKGVPFLPVLWRLLPSHYEILLIGWLFQLAMGVAFWIMPRFGGVSSRGNETFFLAALILLNLGILLASLSPWFGWLWLLGAGRLLEALGGISFLLHVWRRVKPFGKPVS